jgi:hypothetical protein
MPVKLLQTTEKQSCCIAQNCGILTQENDNMVSSLQHSSDTTLQDMSETDDTVQQQARDIARLSRYIEQMHHDILAVESSRAWRIGYGLMALAKRLLGRNRGGDSFASIHDTYSRYHHWKKTRD